jgi:Acetyltransferase (GNAT) domain
VTDIRPLERADLPAVARLFALVWRGEEVDRGGELERFFASTLLDNPWADPELPSLVATEGEEIVGFIGSNTRRITFDGAPRRMVCSAHLVAHPRVRGQAVGARLMKSLLAGPQDLTITDGATDDVRRMWEAFGGVSVPLGALSFVRLFMPAALAADLALDRRGKRIATSPLRFVTRTADRAAELVARRRLVPPSPETNAAPLTPTLLVANVDDVASTVRLRSAYDKAYVTWLFGELARVEERGTLWADGIPRGRLWAEAVRTNGTVVGWYVCHHREGGFCRVLQFATAPRAADDVFAQLSFRARLFGAAALYGRLEPSLVAPVTNAPYIVRRSDGRLLVHSRDPEIATAVRAGDALLTRMDGEWW